MTSFLFFFFFFSCSAGAVIWKVFADVACTGRAPPCQLPHLERLRFGKQSGEEDGLFSMPAYMKRSFVRPREERANPPLHNQTSSSTIEGNPPKIPDSILLLILQFCEAGFVLELYNNKRKPMTAERPNIQHPAEETSTGSN